MRLDQVRLFELLKAYEKSGLDRKRSQGQDRELPLPVRDEVILSTEAKRRQIFGRIRDQVIERLRSVPSSHRPDRHVDKILAEVTDALDADLLHAEERERITRESLGDLLRSAT